MGDATLQTLELEIRQSAMCDVEYLQSCTNKSKIQS